MYFLLLLMLHVSYWKSLKSDGVLLFVKNYLNDMMLV